MDETHDYKGRKIPPGEAERVELRLWAEAMSDTDLAAAIANWELEQTRAGAGLARAAANRHLGYLRREMKKRSK